MKRTAFIFTALILLGLSACNEAETSDPSNDNNSAEGVEGTWDLVSFDQVNGENKIDGQLVATFHSESSNEQGSYTLNADGSWQANIGYTNNLTMVIFGIEQTQSQVIPATSQNGTYAHDENNDVLSVTVSGGETMDYDVTELSANKMVLEADYYQEEVDQGVTASTSSHFVLTLGR